MIVSRPKKRALFSIGVFLIISFSLGFVNLRYIIAGDYKWYNLLIVLLFLPLALVILIRQFVSFKIITIDKDTIKVAHPFIIKGYSFKLSQIISWEETIINTKNGEFKELFILSSSYKLKLTIQENSNYVNIIAYLRKKIPGKKKTITD